MSTRNPDPLDTLLEEVQREFRQHIRLKDLLALSTKLQAELEQHMVSSPQCMLPSYNYELPTGQEQGTYLALEVGGSNLRIALVELNGRNLGMRIQRIICCPINPATLELKECDFFDWMAERIGDLFQMEAEFLGHTNSDEPLPMGVAWSFPIDQTSVRSGNVLGMGKGFHCAEYLIGRDLGDIITQACQRADLNVRLDAIVNDSSSALLARAYLDHDTRLATILGTGMNAAVYLPVTALSPLKFRSTSPPHGSSPYVVTNTELSMFGKSVFPTTRWDKMLNATHILPDYQPFEYLVAGKYIGEIVRLILLEATQTAGLFDGLLAPSLARAPYSLDTKDLAVIDIDESHELVLSRSLFNQRHPALCYPDEKDMMFIKHVVRRVSTRSIAYFAVGIHALTAVLQRRDTREMDHITIGCDGSIINKYPHYMERAQITLNQMIESGNSNGQMRVSLERTTDSAVLGAAVAGAMAAGGVPESFTT